MASKTVVGIQVEVELDSRQKSVLIQAEVKGGCRQESDFGI